LPNRRLFSLGSFLKIADIAQILGLLSFTGKVLNLF
jgi:hypothetical protein